MEQLQQLLDSAWQMVVNNYLHVIAAIVILVVGRMVAGWARKLTRESLKRGDVDATLVPFVAKLVYYSVLAVVVIAALNRLGVATTSVIAIFGAAGLAVGLALQGTLANFASGIMLLIFRPFDLGDFVDAGGTTGTVEEIGIFSTTLKSPDNIRITVPNGQVYGATIKNFNGYETRRIDMVMGISYDDNIQTAMDTIRSIVTADDRVLSEPEVQIAVANLGDSSVDLVVRPWCNAADYWGLKFDLNRQLKEGLESAGCSIPYPQTDVHLQQVAS
ncbi:MAG: mechanosensitive ion channel [Acidobacteria bacterium]|nr:mechanosensitive ion channel [Candidatus Sulfomarinibacter sp. MAG AM2]MBD3872109.1 mechanosensitive ion channel [Candidatus Sulfomarinibacter sp. MAG AM1]